MLLVMTLKHQVEKPGSLEYLWPERKVSFEKGLVCRPRRLATPLWWPALTVMKHQWEQLGRYVSPCFRHRKMCSLWKLLGHRICVLGRVPWLLYKCGRPPSTLHTHNSLSSQERSGSAHLEAVLGPSCWVICLHSKCKSKLHTLRDLYFHEREKHKSSCLGRPISIMYFCLIFSSKTWLRVSVPTCSRV